MGIEPLFAFALMFFVFAASPGPDNVTIIARTIANGAASGLAYRAGTVVGILIFVCVAAFGLSVVAAKMTFLMTMLRYVGAAYLVWTGYKMWAAEPVAPELQQDGDRGRLLGIFATGVALNLGNPKMPLFYVALLPNFVGPSLSFGQVGQLAVVILTVEVVVGGGHVFLASRARRLLRSPQIVRNVNRPAGGTMIGAAAAVVALR